MVACEDSHRGRLGKWRRAGVGHAGQPDSQELELAQGARRFREATVVLSGLVHGHDVHRADGGARIVEGVCHPVLPSFLVNGPTQRTRHGPAAQCKFGRRVEISDVAHAEIRDGHDVARKAENLRQYRGPVEADPTDAEPFGPRRQPQVLHGETRRIVGHLRLRVPAEDVGSPALEGGGHDEVQWSLADGLHLEILEGTSARSGQRRGKPPALLLDVVGHLAPDGGIGEEEEVPGLGKPDRWGLVGRGQDPVEHIVGHGRRQKTSTHIATGIDDLA